jgi:hypothetical protein
MSPVTTQGEVVSSIPTKFLLPRILGRFSHENQLGRTTWTTVTMTTTIWGTIDSTETETETEMETLPVSLSSPTSSPTSSTITLPTPYTMPKAALSGKVIAPVTILLIVVVGGLFGLFYLCCLDMKAQRIRRLNAARATRLPVTPTAAEIQAVENNTVTNSNVTGPQRFMTRNNTSTTMDSCASLTRNAAPLATRKNSTVASAPALLDAIESYPSAKDREKYLKLTGQKRTDA